MRMQISEKLIAHIWQRHLATNLVTDAGQQFQVIYPGRISHTSGCDFRDAIFTINGKTTRGDIEVHVKSSHWYSHGHHRDPKYNKIALHIVWWHDSRSPIRLQNSKSVPTICLNPLFTSPLKLNQLANPSSCPQARSYSNTKSLNELLITAGEKRFAAKVAFFRKALDAEEAGQVLFRGIARALGYAQNSEPCEQLANRLSLGFLEKLEPKADATRQAWILGTAGLLPSQRRKSVEGREIERLEAIWQSTGVAETMKETDWCFFRVRPNNFPTRRLVALSYLLARYHRTGLLRAILSLTNKAPSGAEHQWLENGLTIPSRGYWKNHLDFGVATKRNSALLGHEKASEMVINIILPFVYAWGEVASEPKLKEKASEIYRRYPEPGDNETTHHMKQQLLLKPGIHLSAPQQQGLIHLFRAYCRYRNCTECPAALSRG